MAGETEDCISFQADRLPTGSISFGRFELESLSWERRSSFSHNRYLEEVEKYSTPGSVTQKRAILEAHFKKKPLLPQASLENQFTAECQTAGNDLDHHTGCSDEFEDHGDDERRPEFIWYDDTPSGSDGHDMMECELQETWPSEISAESVPYNVERAVDRTCELSDHDEVIHNQWVHEPVMSNKDDLHIVSEQEPDNKAVIMEELLEKKEAVEEQVEKKEATIVEELKSDVSSNRPVVEKKKSPTLNKRAQRAPLKGKEAVDQKTAKTKQINKLPVQQNMRKPSTERSYVSSGKALSRSTGNLETETTRRTKSVKQSTLRAPTPKSPDPKTSKEPSINTKAKVSRGNPRSDVNTEKDLRIKKSTIMPHSVSGKSEMDVRRPVSRSKRVPDSAKEETKQNGVIFSLKSDERAEKRKEYYMKLEEKLHAKEAEMSEIQARTQEQTEAAIKQFRRTLNFKATPMPSFYHEATSIASEGKKKVTTKPQKLQSKSANLGIRTSHREKSPSLPKASDQESPSSDEPNQASGSAKPTNEREKDVKNKPVRSANGQRREVVDHVKRSNVGDVIKRGIVGGKVAVRVAS
ncbi:protein WVD2-like 7 isoform X1 [Asparagus officinalis]|uniref:protein WVD2-like 7 isoform X1 n=1 Tax=Asparagus officinalis TaxID=4686 RepID=UPI00098DE8F6|nr:protein WVD2-like 7 isoform X1 [Asparagus officinalis]XP_020251714.1 protein WVD2-like 7 isoform X1 [Asparagus officinalis]XP_020251715.1 protein WVD2-like 7 isoform X1 [Asparagus officinalis]